MSNRIDRMEFADFLDRLVNENATRDDWRRSVVAHYADEGLERIRRDLVRIAISREQHDAPSWSTLDRQQFKRWADQLRHPPDKVQDMDA
jgi:hypothetical protein